MYPPPGPPKPQKGLLEHSAEWLANILAAIAAMIGAPLLYQATVPYFLDAVSQSYNRDVLELMDLVWFGLMFPLIFFSARITIGVAITTAAMAVAYRYGLA